MLAGFVLRAVALPGPGTGDLTVWKVWSSNAARHGVGEMYGVGGAPPERRELEYAGAKAVDYPRSHSTSSAPQARPTRSGRTGAFPTPRP